VDPPFVPQPSPEDLAFVPRSAVEPPLPSESAAEAAAQAHAIAENPTPTVTAEEAALRASAPPTEVIQAIQRRNWTRGLFALVASIALLVGIGWGIGAVTDALRTPPAVKTLALIESADDARSASAEIGEAGEATLHWSDSVGEAVLVATGLPAVDDGKTFELWFVRGDEPISAGTFDAADGEATAQLAGEMQAGDAVAITVEQRGGSPDGVPTTDPIVAIASEEE
jgi:anti-sigma-K factor RskA